jgi:hypothetical protein
MYVDLRPVRKLRESAAARSVLGPIMEAVCSSPAELSRLRVVCDWIQYKQNFRDPVVSRPIADNDLEIAFDLRRCNDIDLNEAVKQTLAGQAELEHIALEPWGPGRDSCLWRFNALYWQALTQWEQATGRQYEQSLPGGESDARNTEAARELILELFRIWDDLDARRALPEELYILELGVGNGSQAKTWLDEFVQLDRRHGREYYHRLRYLMGDYSPHVLERARQAVAHHGARVSALVVEATRPSFTLGFLSGKAFLVYISNVYDNLPTDELATIGGRTYLVQTQAYLSHDDAEAIAAQFQPDQDQPGQSRLGPADLRPLIDRLLRIGPELLCESTPHHFPDPGRAVAFWQAIWTALRLRERYVPLEGLDSYQVSPDLTGEILRPLLEAEGDVRMHVSNGAVASFTGTLPLLHPFGRVQCHDLFLTGSPQYRTGFYGPGKYDGSVVNWVNGPLLQLVASRRGFGVQFAPFRQRPGSNIVTLTAQARDLTWSCCRRPWWGHTPCRSGWSGSRPSTTSAGSARSTSPRSTTSRSRPRSRIRSWPASTSCPTVSCAAITTSTTSWPGFPASISRSGPRPTTSTTTKPRSPGRCPSCPRVRRPARGSAWPRISGSPGC